MLGLEGRLVDRVLACKCEDPSLISRTHVKSKAWWYMLAMPSLRGQSQVNPWSSLASQPGLLGKFQASEIETLSQDKCIALEKQFLTLSSGLHMHARTCSHTQYEHRHTGADFLSMTFPIYYLTTCQRHCNYST